ncbi:hypothetical protein Tco_1569019 [Tanacetum coccineum]
MTAIQRYTLVFQQHQDEPIYDAWTRFKKLIQRVPHHGLDLLSLTQFFYDHVDDCTQIDLDFAADGNHSELSGEEAWNITWDKVENPNPQSSPQVLPLFEEYTLPVTYPEEVKETLRTSIEVDPLDETQLEDLGLNTCNHDIPLSSKEVPSFDKTKPQPQPLPTCPPLDISLGDKRGLEPPNKPHGPDSFRMKKVDHLTNNTSPSPHVESFQSKDTYCHYHPCIGDPKKHYGFKPGLLGLSGSLGVDFSKLGMIEDDWKLESKEVSFLGRGLNSPVRIKETHQLEHKI